MFIPGSRPDPSSSTGFTIMSQPSAGDFRPWPTLPRPAADPGDGEFHILPFPGPGEGQFHILPFPMPGDGPFQVPGSPRLPERVAGTEGDDRIEFGAGAVAAGLGGDDVFVLSAAGANKQGQPLAVITDFNTGDSLDLSRLGPDAQILAREGPPLPWGPERVSIDFTGDGAEDGFVLLGGGRPGLAHEPFPMPMVRGEGVSAVFTGIGDSGFAGGGIRLMGDHFTGDGAFDLSLV